ncbi:NADP-dependent succinate-semialdehyde dehydrogenase [Erythrobacter westpacificensis]|uniref:NADP-dependent succinate-semialdehyde dehydrogenase n=1 Tax=Erythrobacter westpacificensis TaxID=1055231 RepID=A0ABP9JZ27_9SPHN
MNRQVDLCESLSGTGLWRQSAYIGGEWIDGDAQLDVDNPATGAIIGSVPHLGAAEAERAVRYAQSALDAWKGRTAKERGAILRRWAQLMHEHADALATIMTAEQGKPLAEATGEVAYAAAFLEWFAEEARRVMGEMITPHQPDRRLLVFRQAVGVVAAITPWNFPLAMITRKAGPALAAGCTFVVKPSELTPFSALALAALAEEAGVPPGVFNVVTGDAAAIGDVLTTSEMVNKFTFTGSTAVGKMLAAKCAGTVKRVSLELGGNAPFIVFADADLEEAVKGALASKFRNSGQTCVCANRFLVEGPMVEPFAAALGEAVAALNVGDGFADGTNQGPLINAAAAQRVHRHVAEAMNGGAVRHTGGTAHDAGERFYTPTVLSGVSPDALLWREETFGPLAAITRFSDEAEAIELANRSRAGLAAYVYTRDASRQWRMMEQLEYGMVGVNTGLISTEVAPFGGIKESGLGREGSHLGMDDYLNVKLGCLAV